MKNIVNKWAIGIGLLLTIALCGACGSNQKSTHQKNDFESAEDTMLSTDIDSIVDWMKLNVSSIALYQVSLEHQVQEVEKMFDLPKLTESKAKSPVIKSGRLNKGRLTWSLIIETGKDWNPENTMERISLRLDLSEQANRHIEKVVSSITQYLEVKEGESKNINGNWITVEKDRGCIWIILSREKINAQQEEIDENTFDFR